jgi:hypothetical protein
LAKETAPLSGRPDFYVKLRRPQALIATPIADRPAAISKAASRTCNALLRSMASPGQTAINKRNWKSPHAH